MDYGLKGQVAVVTGSTSGIGLGLAEALAQQGVNVVLNGLGDRDEIEAIRAGMSARNGVEVLYHDADMTQPHRIADLVSSTRNAFGRLDILVNNAGIQHVAPVDEFPTEQWDRIIAINLTSAFHATKAAIPPMKAAGRGRIVNIASAHALVASPFKSAYVAAKHGIVGLTKAAALECATTGVTVNAICPGWVLTPLVQKQVDARAAKDGVDNAEASRRLLGEKQPSMTFVTPEQLAELALFMCSPAADNVRGVAWNMDGGWVAQ